MERIKDIDLAGAVETVELQRAAQKRDRDNAVVNAAINELLITIASKNERIVAEVDRAAKMAKAAKDRIADMEADLDIDEKRLKQIKKGNWDAMDPNFGRPKTLTGGWDAVQVHITSGIEREMAPGGRFHRGA